MYQYIWTNIYLKTHLKTQYMYQLEKYGLSSIRMGFSRINHGIFRDPRVSKAIQQAMNHHSPSSLTIINP